MEKVCSKQIIDTDTEITAKVDENGNFLYTVIIKNTINTKPFYMQVHTLGVLFVLLIL